MKALFVMRHPAAVRSLSSVLRLLDERGHRVHLAFGGIKPEAHRVLQRLADESRGLTFGALPGPGSPGWDRRVSGWSQLARRLRVDADYLRYLEPTYADAPALRARAAESSGAWLRRAAAVLRLGGPGAVRALRGSLEAVERCLEPPPHVCRFLADLEPDVVVVTHLARDSVQVDYVRAARRLGLHTAYPVFSWDNLTNKGLVHEVPELVLVWNDLQRDEAVSLHGIPPDRVRVAGAWSYDHWFEWAPSRSREDFCTTVGLRADRPLILYVCSSGFVARDEVAFVRRWLAALRARGGVLGEAGVVVRPHPRNAAQWTTVRLEDPQATVWPQRGEEPLEVVSRQNYYDSIYHAAAVVGINTSAQIESAIVGRPVHTVLAEEFRDTQQGTLHFRYLRADDFGHLYAGATMDEHLDQLEASLRGRADAERNRRFLERFVRPLGLDVAATPLYVGALEELAARPAPVPAAPPAAAALVRRALRPAVAVVERRAGASAKRRGPEGSDELRALVRRLRRERGAAVAMPWLGDEAGELLFWVPFLRWAQTATYGLRDRLTVVSRRSSAAWYAGLGARRVAIDDLLAPAALSRRERREAAVEEALREALGELAGNALRILPRLVDERRAELAERGPDEPFHRRRLELALLDPEPPRPDDLPETFVATNRAPDPALAEAFGAGVAVVSLADLDRPAQAAVVSRARAFVGDYGVEALVSTLAGVPTVAALHAAVPHEELRVVRSHLSRPPFGPLALVAAATPPGELAARAAALGAAPAALAGV